MDIVKSHESRVKSCLDVSLSLSLDDVDLSVDSSHKGSQISRLCIVFGGGQWLHSVVSSKVSVSIWGTVLASDISTESESLVSGTVSLLVGHVLTMGVSMSVVVTNVVSKSVVATHGSASISLVDST